MKTLIERLRESAAPPSDPDLNDEAAAEIEHLMLDLHTERATVAALRESAALRVRFHAAELADVTAELANAKAVDIHSCHDGCTRSGCVAGRLTAERDALRDWVKDMGLQMHICTRNILGKVCEYCQCKHRKTTP